MKKNSKVIKWTICLIITVLVLFMGYKSNRYLKAENLLFYKTGTNKKAVLKTTWNMSLKEVQRANKSKLKEGLAFARLEPEFDKLLNISRVMAYDGDTINLFSASGELSYEFFDNRLFRFNIIGETWNPKKFDSLMVASLELNYGKMKKDSTQFDGVFLKDSVYVSYRQFDNTNDKGEIQHRFVVIGTYLPIVREIVAIGNKEQKSIFQ